MVSPFFAIRILKNRLWRIVLYSYIHNGDSKGDYSFSKGDTPSDISSPPEKIPFHREDNGMKEISPFQRPKNFSKKFSMPPTPKATGKITADIQRAFLRPLSLTIIKN
jgi:hypothetical protein